MTRMSRSTLALAALLALAACSAPQADTAATPARIDAASDVASGTASAQGSGSTAPASAAVPVIDGTGYVAARAALLAANWRPAPSPTCVRDTFGDVPAGRCSTEPAAAACTACDDTPELQSCSGSGQCLMRFTRADTPGALHVVTYGDIADRALADGGLVVQSHEQVAPTR